MKENKTRFIIFSSGHSGSTLLVDLLNSHPDIHCEKELMNPKEEYVTQPWLRKFFWFFPGLLFRYRHFCNRRNKVFGFTLFPYHVRKVERRVQQLSQAGWKIIYLRRRNIVSQALSNIMNQEMDQWHRRKAPPQDLPQQSTPERKTIPPGHLLHGLMTFTTWRDWEGKALQGIPHLELVYEDMLENRDQWPATMEKVFRFLGVDAVEVATSLMKTYPGPYAEIIANYGELMEAVKRSRYACLLDEQDIKENLHPPTKAADPALSTVLVTGASGYVGSSLCRLLQDDFRFVGLSRRPVGGLHSYAQLDRLPPVDAVIHLAGLAHDVTGYATEQVYREANVELTKRIFDYFLRSDADTFIFFSSVQAVAEELPHGAVLTEAFPARPRSVYGRSKREAEEYILQPLSEYPGKRVVILRPAMIYGPGNKGNMNLLVDLLKRRWPWPLGAFENTRSFVSIDNVAFAVKGILTGPVPSGIYNLADDQALATNELIRLIAQALGYKPRVWKVPPMLVRAAARTGDFLPLPLNSQRLRKLTGSFVVSNKKLKAALGLEHMPSALPASLMQALELESSSDITGHPNR
jgi:nucleoside-diphosphate-sugar epimerase/LPS sulfotransferase NodH